MLLDRVAQRDPELAELLAQFALLSRSLEWDRVRQFIEEIVDDVLLDFRLKRAA